MGIVYILLAAVLFGSTPSVENFVLLSGADPEFVAFAVVAASGLMALAAGVIRGDSFRLTRKQLICMILTGVIGSGITEICLIRAYTMVPAGVATMVHFFFPTIVCAVSVLFFHEKLTRYKLAAVLLAIGGLYGIADGQTGGSILGVLTAGITSFTFAFYYLMSERSSIKDIPPMVMVFYLHFFGAAACAVPLVVKGGMPAGFGIRSLLLLSVSGLMCFVAYTLLNRGIPKVGAGTAAFINMLEPITSIMLSVIIYRSRLSVMTAVGCFLIVCAPFASAMEHSGRTHRGCLFLAYTRK